MASGKQRFKWGDGGRLKAVGRLDMREGRVLEP